MRPPPFYVEQRITQEELEASFVPCSICGAIEKNIGGGLYRIAHDLEKHGIAPHPRGPRLEFSEFVGSPKLPENVK